MSRVTHVAISDTLCDVASVHAAAPPSPPPSPGAPAPPPRAPSLADEEGTDYENDTVHKYNSLVRVHTCNGTFVGESNL